MINHPSQHAANHWIAFIDIPKCAKESDIPVMFVNINGQVLKISKKFFSLCHNQIDCGF